jgi:hypothetical protein
MTSWDRSVEPKPAFHPGDPLRSFVQGHDVGLGLLFGVMGILAVLLNGSGVAPAVEDPGREHDHSGRTSRKAAPAANVRRSQRAARTC